MKKREKGKEEKRGQEGRRRGDADLAHRFDPAKIKREKERLLDLPSRKKREGQKKKKKRKPGMLAGAMSNKEGKKKKLKGAHFHRLLAKREGGRK